MNGSALSGTTFIIEEVAAPALSVHAALAELPPAASRLFADPADDLFASRLWFATLCAAGLGPESTPLFALCSAAGTPFALLPLAGTADGAGLRSLTGPYSAAFRPLFAPGASAETAGALIGRLLRGTNPVRLEALEAEAPGLDLFVAGLRHAGLAVLRFDHFGNWYEHVAGLDFAAYLAARPGALRTTIRRKARRAGAGSGFAVITGGDALEAGIAEYEAAYARSWKEPEPFPPFNPALMRATAEAGLLRLGILRLSGRVAAVQFWVVSGGSAMLLKLAHDEALAAHSPGTVLTALMIERLLGEGRIAGLDFGRGDDLYKRLWATRRRQRIGLVLANPRKLRGIAEIGRAFAGGGRRRLLSALAGGRGG
jgi:CelD/BcsL family acetyltransferase involved in cellulose biosynthesis